MTTEPKVLDAIYDRLKPIAERSAMLDTQAIAKCLMLLIEVQRGDEKRTDISLTHHV